MQAKTRCIVWWAATLAACSAAYAGEDPPDLLAEALEGPLKGHGEIVFALRPMGQDGHWYANFSYYAPDTKRLAYGEGGRLSRLNLRTGAVTVLLDDPKGGVRDPQVHYDGTKIVFSYRKGDSSHYNLYEIGCDGSGRRQITEGPWDDIEPTYLPDGGILFCSSRCRRWVNCWVTQVAVLYRCDADGANLRQLSANIEHDNTPWPLPDGRVLYQRWEYVDRSQVHYHHLWTTNPDGTGQMVYYGNMHPGTVMIDAKPIPGTNRVLAIFSPGHGRKEHAGAVTIVRPDTGPDDRASARTVHSGEAWRDPYPLAKDLFLAAKGTEVFLMNGLGDVQSVYALPEADRKAGLHCHEPRLLAPRPRERVIPPRVDPRQPTGQLFVADVHLGRNMDGVEPGEIKKLLVLETLPKPVNFTGGMEPLSYGGTFTLERVLGTVPVEPDGSAFFEAPAMRSLLLVALDENDLAVKRMQSFFSVQPGERLSCVGCHEQRTRTVLPRANRIAIGRPPSPIEPVPDMPDVFDFPRDIQPILDRHCVPCHGYEKTDRGGPRAGGVILTGDRGPLYSHSYFTLSARRQLADGRNLPRSNYPPRALGSSGSPLMKKILERHHDVKLSRREIDFVRLWIDTGAPYPGTYAGLGAGMIGGYEQNQLDRSDLEWVSMQAARSVLADRCGACHRDGSVLPSSPSDNRGMPPWAVDYEDPRLRYSRHILYNLSRPEQSLLVLAPLATEAGGYGLCAVAPDPSAAIDVPPFASTDDPDYAILLASIEETAERLEAVKRFDMAGFRPRPGYIREMQRYGVLSQDLAPDTAIDPYEADRAYWDLHVYRPTGGQ